MRPEQRLRKKWAFDFLFKKGQFFRGKFLHLWVFHDAAQKFGEAQGPKVGWIVSRRTHLRANKRNLWKRRLREAFRRLQKNCDPRLVLMVQARGAQEVPSYEKIFEELRMLMKEANEKAKKSALNKMQEE